MFRSIPFFALAEIAFQAFAAQSNRGSLQIPTNLPRFPIDLTRLLRGTQRHPFAVRKSPGLFLKRAFGVPERTPFATACTFPAAAQEPKSPSTSPTNPLAYTQTSFPPAHSQALSGRPDRPRP